jgi:hypothetical protein
MSPCWLPLLALTLAGISTPAAPGQGLPLPASEPIAPPSDLTPSTPILVESAASCGCLIPPIPDRPRCVPDYFQFLTGYSFKSGLGPMVPNFDYIPLTARFGWYCTDPMAPGAISVVIGSTSGVVTQSFGTYFTGPSLGFRYERRPDRDLVPYIQIGSGFAFNDAFHVKTQRAIGSVAEFCDQFEGGLRYHVKPHLSLDFEAAYMHISNAGFAGRNSGVNNVGLMAGLTYTFGGR